ncbi:hypothetical protein N9L18_01070 [Candidatus Pacebacteria bacterium]|nr:hypothetical protein [Candidatus Paceibacterota bacterium]
MWYTRRGAITTPKIGDYVEITVDSKSKTVGIQILRHHAPSEGGDYYLFSDDLLEETIKPQEVDNDSFPATRRLAQSAVGSYGLNIAKEAVQEDESKRVYEVIS